MAASDEQARLDPAKEAQRLRVTVFDDGCCVAVNEGDVADLMRRAKLEALEDAIERLELDELDTWRDPPVFIAVIEKLRRMAKELEGKR